MVMTIANQPAMTRVNRQPNHTFSLRVRPYQIVPFMLAPVIPGETLENLWFEAREVSDPLASPLLGMKSEFHFFYVKLRDLGHNDILDINSVEEMFTNPLGDPLSAAVSTVADVPTYHTGGINWTDKCLQAVILNHFRDRGEAIGAKVGNYYLAQVRDQHWMDSLIDSTALDDGASIGDPGTATTPEQLQQIMDRFELLQSYGWSEMSFEDYLATHGVMVPKAQLGLPERLYSLVKWTYPTNTIDPTDGSPTSAASWVFKEMKRDKKRFTEPGFILGVHVVRHKVYFGAQAGQLAHFMTKGLDWLPAILNDNPQTSLREFASVNSYDGPLGAPPTNGYWIDLRDLLIHGEQFVNFAEDASAPRAALPTAALVRKYLASGDLDEIFAAVAPANQIRSDGMANLTIVGVQRDYTRGQVLTGV